MFKPASTLMALALSAAFALPVPASALTLTTKPAAVASHSDVTLVEIQKQPDAKFRRQKVRLVTEEKAGTIIVDTNNKFLYFIQGPNKAVRYGIGVGREGFGWSGIVKVSRKAEWPSWTPPKEMIAREAKKGHFLPDYMEGGEDNPLGARALYLNTKRGDSGFRIHGTNQPWSIGLNMSSGCIRMMNKDVIDLYSRAEIGAKVIVIGPGNKQGKVSFQDKGIDILRTMFGG